MIRYNSPAEWAWCYPAEDDPSRFSVTFDVPRHGVAPGQAIVCYAGDRTLGGGWIQRCHNSSSTGYPS
jgi:tRNA-specific 2-thiouridylase